MDEIDERDLAVEDIFLEPPDVSVDSDADSGEEDGGGSIDNLNRNMLSSAAEVVLREDEGISSDEDTTSKEEPSTSQGRRSGKSNKDSIKYSWTKKEIPLDEPANWPQQDPEVKLQHLTPVQIFEYFFDQSFYDHLQHEMRRYATFKNSTFDIPTTDELKLVLAILFLSGYNTVPSRRDYWSSGRDLQCPFVSNAISRNRFEAILQHIHFADNQRLDKSDKMAKLRPLMKHLQTRFQAAYPMNQL